MKSNVWYCLLTLLAGCSPDLYYTPHDPVIHVEDECKPNKDNKNPTIAQIRILIVEETEERSKLTAAQQEILTSTKLRQYAKDHCVLSAKGTPEFRIIDKDEDVSNLSKPMQDAFKLPRSSLAWLYITNGKTGFSGPLPANVDAVITTADLYYKGVK